MMGFGQILLTAVNAVSPVILVILLGYGLKRIGFVTKEFLKIGNNLVFHVCLPCMLFVNVYDIESFASINWEIVLYCTAMLLVLFGLGLIVAMAVTKVPERRGVIWQCTFRSNFAIIGLSLAGALGGAEAMAVAAIVSSFTVPLFNVLAVIALSVFVDNGGSRADAAKQMAVSIAKNPLILAVAAGLVCLGIRELQMEYLGEVVFSLRTHTKFLYTTLDNLKAVASPFALLVLGGQFEFSAVRELRREITAATLWRIVAAPLLGIGCAAWLSSLGLLHCGIHEYPALIAMFGSPVAVSSAIMARSMGGDEQLATQLVVWTSLFSIVTIFAEVCILMGLGLLAV